MTGEWETGRSSVVTRRLAITAGVLAIAVMAATGGPAGAEERHCPPRPPKDGVDFSLPCVWHSPLADVEQEVRFSPDSTSLSDEAKAILDRQAQILRQFPDVAIKAIGYADVKEAPTAAEKAALGWRRADAVRRHLIAKGIAADRVTAVGHEYAAVIAREIDEDALAAMRSVFVNAWGR